MAGNEAIKAIAEPPTNDYGVKKLSGFRKHPPIMEAIVEIIVGSYKDFDVNFGMLAKELEPMY